MNDVPKSKLTIARPDIWQRGLNLATSLTSYIYEPKLLREDGTIYACGGGPTIPPTPKEELDELDRTIKYGEGVLRTPQKDPEYWVKWVKVHKERREELLKKHPELQPKEGASLSTFRPTVVVPDGSMEWLLHEVGHWVAADLAERVQINYGLGAEEVGHGADREWQAWAYEEIILAPFAPARALTVPTARDGVGFSRNQIPSAALVHIERRMQELQIDVEAWRVVWGDWYRFEKGLRDPSWRREQ